MTTVTLGHQQAVRRVIPVMGTVVSVDVRRIDLPAADAAAAVDAVAGWLHWVDATFSTYRADSQVSRLRRGELRLGACDRRVAEVLDACAAACNATDGYFTALFDGAIDPTGLVKGWAVQQASLLLRDRGLPDHAVNGGGDVACAGEPAVGQPWRVGIVDPQDGSRVLTTVECRGLAVATSGTAERGQHVLDPYKARPATGLHSATVVGPDLTEADAYATAVVACGLPWPGWFGRLAGYHLLTVDEQGGVRQSTGFPTGR